MFCEDSCIYSSYNFTNNKVDCDCSTKIEMLYNPLLRNFSYNKLNSDFNKKISKVNFKVLKCINKGFQNFFKNNRSMDNISNIYMFFYIKYICHTL